MTRYGMDENGNRVPIETLMSPKDREEYLAKIKAREDKVRAKKKELDAKAHEEALRRQEAAVVARKIANGDSLSDDYSNVPEGAYPCDRPDEECGLRHPKDGYCLRAQGSACDIDIEKADTKAGVEQPGKGAPHKGDKPQEIDMDAPESDYTRKDEKDLARQRAEYAARCDKFDVKELKKKADKLEIKYAKNAGKSKMIELLKEYFDGDEDSQESKASKL